jgi:hypothetical protein
MTSTAGRTAMAAILLVGTTTLTAATLGAAAPAAQAARADSGARLGRHAPPYLSDIGQIVAFRKAQQAQYLVDHRLLALR